MFTSIHDKKDFNTVLVHLSSLLTELNCTYSFMYLTQYNEEKGKLESPSQG